jgi:hypothetical protein
MSAPVVVTTGGRGRERLVVTFEIPTVRLLTSNKRRHYRDAAKIAADLREEAGEVGYVLGAHDEGTIVVRVMWPTRKRRDVHNIMPTVKPLIDGLVDAGVLPDDDDDVLRGPFLMPTRRTSSKAGHATLELELVPGPARLVILDVVTGAVRVMPPPSKRPPLEVL